MYNDTFISHGSEALSPHIRLVRSIMQIREPERLHFACKIAESDLEGERKRRVLRQPRKAKRVVSVPFGHRIFPPIQKNDYFTK